MDPNVENTREFVSVMEARDSIAAALAKGLLESEGIPVLVESFQIPWYNGIMTAAAGAWGRILVPAHLASSAVQILSAFFSEHPKAPEDSSQPA